jgi:DnaJ-class molecular chaperone
MNDERFMRIGDVSVRKPQRPSKAERRGKHRCETCGGTGRIPGVVKTTGRGKGMGSTPGACPDCDGMGWIDPAEVT